MAYEKEIQGYITMYVQSKTTGKQPDLTGFVSIPLDLLEDSNNTEYCHYTDKNGVEYLQFRVAMWEDADAKRNEPLLKGNISKQRPKKSDTPPETPKAFNPDGRKKLQ